MHHRQRGGEQKRRQRNRGPTRRPCCCGRRARSRARGRAAPCRPDSSCRRSHPSRASARRLPRRRRPAAHGRGAAPPRATGRSARRAPAARGAGACTRASARRPPRSAWSAHAATSVAMPCCSTGMRRRRYSRRSSETCSLRERPVCSRRPASPMRSTSLRSTKLCTSSSGPETDAGSRRPSSRMASQAGDDRARVVGREHACRAERLRPREAAGHVVLEQRAIEAERDAEVERSGIGRGVEPAGPERHGSAHQFGQPLAGALEQLHAHDTVAGGQAAPRAGRQRPAPRRPRRGRRRAGRQ